MRIALGTTVLERGLRHGGLDGIGVYTQALLAELKNHTELLIQEVAFNRIRGHFHLEMLKSLLTQSAFTDSCRLAQCVDLFHATDHHIPKLTGIPVVATLMDPVPLMRPDWANASFRRVKNTLFRRSTRWASHYITISESVVPDLVEYFGIPQEKITPIHLGVNVSDFSPVEPEEKNKILKKFGLTAGFYLFMGTLQPRKNVMRIIEAFEQLPLDIQKNHPLVIVGRAGWGSDAVIQKMQSLMAKGHVYWLGYVSFAEKKVLLQTAIALVFPSLYEGFGLPVLEAFASQLPVITSTISSLPEIAGDAALLVDPYDTEALSDAMHQVITSSEKRHACIAKGYARAAKMTWASCAEKTINVYQQIINR